MRRSLARDSLARLLALHACLFICVLALAGCADRTELSGTSWKLEQLTVDGHIRQLAPTAPVTLEFQEDGTSYVGSSGCNYYSGSYAVSGDKLRLELNDITARACAIPIMSQEVAYINLLGQAQSYTITSQKLLLRDGNNRAILVYTTAHHAS